MRTFIRFRQLFVSGSRAREAGFSRRFWDRMVRKENAVQADDGEHLGHVGPCAGDAEAVAGVLGSGIERDKGGNAGGVHAVDTGEVEQNILLPHKGSEAVDEGLLLPSDQLVEVVGGDAQGGGGGGCICVHHKYLPGGRVEPGELLKVHPTRQTRERRNRLNPEEIATDCPGWVALSGVRIRERRSRSNTLLGSTQGAGGEVPQKVPWRWKSDNVPVC